jgi:hypothetical protein
MKTILRKGVFWRGQQCGSSGSHLPSKPKALSSNPSAKKKERERQKGRKKERKKERKGERKRNFNLSNFGSVP